MLNKTVSVIIPVYNSACYLKKCLNSVLRQDYPYIEVILVNDGSSDKSPLICEAYSKKHGNIKLIHKQNGGVSSARNTGLSAASGEYILFLDGDDWLPSNALSVLVNSLEANNADMSSGAIVSISECPDYLFKSGSKKLLTDNAQDMFSYLFDLSSTAGYMAAKLFKKSIIAENGILFDKNICHHEDAVFTFEYMKHCLSVAFTDKVVYYYNRLDHGSATQRFFEKQMEWYISDFEMRLSMIGDIATDKAGPLYPELIKSISGFFMNMLRYYNYFYNTENITNELTKRLVSAFDKYLCYSENDSVLSNVWPEWPVVKESIKSGDYLILYDIFPKRAADDKVSIKRKLGSMYRRLSGIAKNIWYFKITC